MNFKFLIIPDDSNSHYDGVIGNDLLKHFSANIDYRSNKIKIENFYIPILYTNEKNCIPNFDSNRFERHVLTLNTFETPKSENKLQTIFSNKNVESLQTFNLSNVELSNHPNNLAIFSSDNYDPQVVSNDPRSSSLEVKFGENITPPSQISFSSNAFRRFAYISNNSTISNKNTQEITHIVNDPNDPNDPVTFIWFSDLNVVQNFSGCIDDFVLQKLSKINLKVGNIFNIKYKHNNFYFPIYKTSRVSPCASQYIFDLLLKLKYRLTADNIKSIQIPSFENSYNNFTWNVTKDMVKYVFTDSEIEIYFPLNKSLLDLEIENLEVKLFQAFSKNRRNIRLSNIEQ